MPIKISQQFDSGSIEVVQAADPRQIDLNLRSDSHADIRQWFHFRLQGARGQACTMRFLNAGQATYAKGYEGYQVAASYDTENWFRVPTTFDGQVMTVNPHARTRQRLLRLFRAVLVGTPPAPAGRSSRKSIGPRP
jgi:murein tripeptide amidase MpaA